MSSRSSSFPYTPRHVAIVLTVASILVVIASPSKAEMESDDILAVIEKRSNRQRYCGPHLVDALSVACGGRYNGMLLHKQKKQNLGLLEDEMLRKQDSDPNYLQRQSPDDADDILRGMQGEPGYTGWLARPDRLPFRERLAARAFTSGALHRKIRGAYDDCCAKSCTIRELRMYCE